MRCRCRRLARLSIGSRPVCGVCFAYELTVLRSRPTEASRRSLVRSWDLTWKAMQELHRARVDHRTAGL